MLETIGDLLGVKKSIANRLAIAHVVERGLPAVAIDRIKASMNLADADLSSALSISVKTLSRVRQTRRALSLVEGDRLYRIARLFLLAQDVFEQDDFVREWFRSPQIGLNNRTPLDTMSTEAGAREVEDLLLRIDHGVLS